MWFSSDLCILIDDYLLRNTFIPVEIIGDVNILPYYLIIVGL